MRRALTDLEKDERRTALLEAALEEFFASGFAAARLVLAPIAFSGLWQVLFSDAPEAHLDIEKLTALHSEILSCGLKAPPSSA